MKTQETITDWFSKIGSYIRDWQNSSMLLSSSIKENRDREGTSKFQEDEKYICITAANTNCPVTMILCPLDIHYHTSVSLFLIGTHGMFFLGSIFWREMMNMSIHNQIHIAHETWQNAQSTCLLRSKHQHCEVVAQEAWELCHQKYTVHQQSSEVEHYHLQ